ncbi:MAG: exopolysaccharide biosynthesis polyprenyl glycosylphosphotransferase [Porticoccaceae bacterium]|jgi:putative colanic acid biosynthesis UDP-glucose lipid carrier transferase|nr:exopolysaccharide biosynthesis polyprenyl glycosylphosphotransferase [Gammaproteobacteria bacterium]TAL05601.1 MAG: exopolysaccharide biosynthesis polyprenyl glycosylphosphotransferase [Porticoccaceae bacterium]
MRTHTPLGSRSNRVLKRAADLVLASVIGLLILPLCVAIALAVRCTSPGPVLFRQSRHGEGGRAFEVYKFRTMYVDQPEPDKVHQARRDDPRVTPVGRFLRRTSLDELPQFLNVLQGRMSIVGPRPHALVHNEYYKSRVESYMWRHRVKPGITGWAQVNGYRGETDTLEKMEKRVEHDLWYIDNWSLWLDLKIIALTVKCVVVDYNAY